MHGDPNGGLIPQFPITVPDTVGFLLFPGVTAAHWKPHVAGVRTDVVQWDGGVVVGSVWRVCVGRAALDRREDEFIHLISFHKWKGELDRKIAQCRETRKTEGKPGVMRYFIFAYSCATIASSSEEVL